MAYLGRREGRASLCGRRPGSSGRGRDRAARATTWAAGGGTRQRSKRGTLRPGVRGGGRRGAAQGGVKREVTKRGGAARRRVASPRLLFRLITGCLTVRWDVLLS